MTLAAVASALERQEAPGAMRRHAALACLTLGLPALVINMGLEEIQKQAKAS